MTIQTKAEAIEILERYYAHIIALGRYEATQIALAEGTIHSRRLRARLKEIDRLPIGDERWMGAIFSAKVFEYTGRMLEVEEASPRTRGGGGGGRPIRIWRLRAGEPLPQRPATWQGQRPLGFPDKIDPVTLKLALDELREIFDLAQLVREHVDAKRRQLILGQEGPTEADIASLEKKVENRATYTGNHVMELTQVGLWLAWKTRRG